MEPESLLPHSQVPATCPYPEPYQSISPGPRHCLWIFHNKISFNKEELLAPRPPPKLEDRPLSAAHDCLFSIFAATLHIGGRSCICILRTRHGVVIGTHLSITWQGCVHFAILPLILGRYFSTLDHCFSTFVRPRPGKFFLHKTRVRSQQIYS